MMAARSGASWGHGYSAFESTHNLFLLAKSFLGNIKSKTLQSVQETLKKWDSDNRGRTQPLAGSCDLLCLTMYSVYISLLLS